MVRKMEHRTLNKNLGNRLVDGQVRLRSSEELCIKREPITAEIKKKNQRQLFRGHILRLTEGRPTKKIWKFMKRNATKLKRFQEYGKT